LGPPEGASACRQIAPPLVMWPLDLWIEGTMVNFREQKTLLGDLL